jgi:flagellar basal-body rod protein FlgF
VIYGLYQSAAGMLVNQYRQNVIANNLANVDTAGFKRDIPSFSERLVEAQRNMGATRNAVLDGQSGGVWSAPTHTDWQVGPADVTGNSLDAAITGRGFFAVQAEGGVRYTRDGAFTPDAQGRLVTAQDGLPVLNQQGGPISLGEDAKSASLTADGKVMVNGQPIAELQVVEFDDPTALRKVGRNLVASDAQPQRVQPNLRIQAVEKSNVDAMAEMASMIEASRAYQINAQMVTTQDQTLGRLLSEVARPVG